MANRTIAISVIFLALNCVMGCGDSVLQLPTAPTSAAFIQPSATGGQEHWSLSRTFTGHTESEGCSIAFAAIGRAEPDSALLIQRSAESIGLFTADHYTYAGTVAGNEFSATVSEFGSTLECEGARIPFSTEAHVSGRFSSDGRSLFGKETITMFLQSGQRITRQWDWQARRD